MSKPRTIALCQQAITQSPDGASQLADGFLAAIADADSAINSFVSVDVSGARFAAKQSDARRARGEPLSPLDGVPFAVKDNIAVAGLPLTAGMATRRQSIANTDAFCVAQLRALGMVMLGKLNMHEGALGADNDNPHFGACHNPHRIGYTPGGSSGGSAAALAAGFAPITLGTDTMGSVRIPAAYCGVVGFKPSYGRISQRGLIPACYALDHVGLLAHEASDLFALYSALIASDPLDPYQQNYPEPISLAAPRFAVLQNLPGFGVESAVEAQFAETLARLPKSLSIAQQISFSDYDFAKMRRAGLLATEADMAVFHADDLRTQPQNFSAELRTMLQYAQQKSAADLAGAQHRMQGARLKANAVFSQCDMLITPTTPQPAFAFGSVVPANQADFTSFANLAGCPAISLPCGSIDGLPVGLQLIAAAGQDQLLIEVAISLQTVLQGHTDGR